LGLKHLEIDEQTSEDGSNKTEKIFDLRQIEVVDKGEYMNIKIAALLVFLIILGGASYYYYDVDTLKFSEIVGETNDPKTDIFVNLFDFDTGLTRYDIHNLSTKSEYWKKSITEVNSIPNQQTRELETEKLYAEMMKDPTMKKITKKLIGLGSQAVYAFLNAVEK
jgi:hypothetical protein